MILNFGPSIVQMSSVGVIVLASDRTGTGRCSGQGGRRLVSNVGSGVYVLLHDSIERFSSS